MRETLYLYFDKNKEMFVSKKDVSHPVSDSNKVARYYLKKLDSLGNFPTNDEIVSEIMKHENISIISSDKSVSFAEYEFEDIENMVSYHALSTGDVKKTAYIRNSFSNECTRRTDVLNTYCSANKRLPTKYKLLSILNDINIYSVSLEDNIKTKASSIIAKIEIELKELKTSRSQIKVLNLVGNHVANILLKPTENAQ